MSAGGQTASESEKSGTPSTEGSRSRMMRKRLDALASFRLSYIPADGKRIFDLSKKLRTPEDVKEGAEALGVALSSLTLSDVSQWNEKGTAFAYGVIHGSIERDEPGNLNFLRDQGLEMEGRKSPWMIHGAGTRQLALGEYIFVRACMQEKWNIVTGFCKPRGYSSFKEVAECAVLVGAAGHLRSEGKGVLESLKIWGHAFEFQRLHNLAQLKGSTQVVQWLHTEAARAGKEIKSYNVSKMFTDSLVRSFGPLSNLRETLEQEREQVLEMAGACGKPQDLVWLREVIGVDLAAYKEDPPKTPGNALAWDNTKRVLKGAACGGNLEVLQWAHGVGQVQWMQPDEFPFQRKDAPSLVLNVSLGQYLMAMAARTDRMEVLDFLHQDRGVPWHEEVLVQAHLFGDAQRGIVSKLQARGWRAPGWEGMLTPGMPAPSVLNVVVQGGGSHVINIGGGKAQAWGATGGNVGEIKRTPAPSPAISVIQHGASLPPKTPFLPNNRAMIQEEGGDGGDAHSDQETAYRTARHRSTPSDYERAWNRNWGGAAAAPGSNPRETSRPPFPLQPLTPADPPHPNLNRPSSPLRLPISPDRRSLFPTRQEITPGRIPRRAPQPLGPEQTPPRRPFRDLPPPLPPQMGDLSRLPPADRDRERGRQRPPFRQAEWSYTDDDHRDLHTMHSNVPPLSPPSLRGDRDWGTEDRPNNRILHVYGPPHDSVSLSPSGSRSRPPRLSQGKGEGEERDHPRRRTPEGGDRDHPRRFTPEARTPRSRSVSPSPSQHEQRKERLSGPPPQREREEKGERSARSQRPSSGRSKRSTSRLSAFDITLSEARDLEGIVGGDQTEHSFIIQTFSNVARKLPQEEFQDLLRALDLELILQAPSTLRLGKKPSLDGPDSFAIRGWARTEGVLLGSLLHDSLKTFDWLCRLPIRLDQPSVTGKAETLLELICKIAGNKGKVNLLECMHTHGYGQGAEEKALDGRMLAMCAAKKGHPEIFGWLLRRLKWPRDLPEAETFLEDLTYLRERAPENMPEASVEYYAGLVEKGREKAARKARERERETEGGSSSSRTDTQTRGFDLRYNDGDEGTERGGGGGSLYSLSLPGEGPRSGGGGGGGACTLSLCPERGPGRSGGGSERERWLGEGVRRGEEGRKWKWLEDWIGLFLASLPPSLPLVVVTVD